MANTEFRATTAMNMRRMLAAPQMRTNASAFDEEQADDEPTVPQRRAPARPNASDASAQGKSVQDVFASMMSQVAGRPVRAVRTPAATPGGGSPAPAVGRNDPCPCGSGKKYKKCCGRNLA